MIDLTNITLEQANKIECALLQMENDFKNKIRRKETLIFYDIDEWIDIIDFE